MSTSIIPASPAAALARLRPRTLPLPPTRALDTALCFAQIAAVALAIDPHAARPPGSGCGPTRLREVARWALELLRARQLLPVADDDWLDEVDMECDGEDEALPPYVRAIPLQGGFGYRWNDDDGLAETLLYALTGTPTQDDEWDEGGPDSAARQLRGQLDRSPHAAAVARLLDRFGPEAAWTGGSWPLPLARAVLEDRVGAFARAEAPLDHVPDLVAYMARATDSVFFDLDSTSFAEMVTDHLDWDVEDVLDVGAHFRATHSRVERGLRVARALAEQPELLPPLLAALEASAATLEEDPGARGEGHTAPVAA